MPKIGEKVCAITLDLVIHIAFKAKPIVKKLAKAKGAQMYFALYKRVLFLQLHYFYTKSNS